jgi:protein-S-isoprenylcysteine O-methyltransferase Ste14
MRVIKSLVGLLFLLFGAVWFLQGANVLKGSPVMSGQSQWMWIGLVVFIAGLVVLWWTWLRRG